jgi:hypothetical protein
VFSEKMSAEQSLVHSLLFSGSEVDVALANDRRFSRDNRLVAQDSSVNIEIVILNLSNVGPERDWNSWVRHDRGVSFVGLGEMCGIA